MSSYQVKGIMFIPSTKLPTVPTAFPLVWKRLKRGKSLKLFCVFGLFLKSWWNDNSKCYYLKDAFSISKSVCNNSVISSAIWRKPKFTYQRWPGSKKREFSDCSLPKWMAWNQSKYLLADTELYFGW